MKSTSGIVLLFLLIGLCSHAQEHNVTLNTNFFLNQRPVFQAGYSFAKDSSNWSMGAHAEFGRFYLTSKEYLTSNVDLERSVGFGVIPEVRRYFQQNDQRMGFFAAGFCRIRHEQNTRQEGVNVSESGIQIIDPSLTKENKWTGHYGVGLGYRSGCAANLLHLEVLCGAYLGDMSGRRRDFSSIQRHQFDQFIRLDVNLVASF